MLEKPNQMLNQISASKSRQALIIVCAVISVLILLLSGCHSTTATNASEYEIRATLDRIRDAFIDHDINTLMLNIHIDYLHNGMSRWELRELWLDRMAEYLLIEFRDVLIEVDGNKAVASFRMKLQKVNETVYSDEPVEHGDISYFINDEDGWSVFGNQQNN